VDVVRGQPGVRCAPDAAAAGTAAAPAVGAAAGAAHPDSRGWSVDVALPPGYLVVADPGLLRLRELTVMYEAAPPPPRLPRATAAAGGGRSPLAAALCHAGDHLAAIARERPLLTIALAYGLLLVYAGTPPGGSASSFVAARLALWDLWSRLPLRRP